MVLTWPESFSTAAVGERSALLKTCSCLIPETSESLTVSDAIHRATTTRLRHIVVQEMPRSAWGRAIRLALC